MIVRSVAAVTTSAGSVVPAFIANTLKTVSNTSGNAAIFSRFSKLLTMSDKRRIYSTVKGITKHRRVLSYFFAR